MYCSSCGTWLPDDARFCTGCGTSLAGSSAGRKKPRWLLPLILGLVLVVGAAGFLLWFFSDFRAYHQAQALFDKGSYAEAETAFLALEDYKDSSEQVKACRYQQAKAVFDQGDYRQAETMFQALADYSDSAEQVKACRYQQAKRCWDRGDYAQAEALLETLGGYSDSAYLLQRCQRALLASTWRGEISFLTVIGEEDSWEIEEDYKEFKDVTVPLILALRSDGSFTLSLEMTAALPAIREAFQSWVPQMLQKDGMTVEDFESQAGMSVDEFIEEGLSDLAEQYEVDFGGAYTEENGSLSLRSEDGERFSGVWSGRTLTLDLDGRSITFTR